MHNFKLLAEQVFVQPMADCLSDKPGLWDAFTDRQSYPGSAHADTRSILLVGPETIDLWSWFNGLSVKAYPAFEDLRATLLPLTQLISIILQPGHRVSEAGRVMLTELKPGGKIAPHRDEGAYAEHFQRLHLVIRGDCTFYCGDEKARMWPGDLWWFNHRERHWVENDAATPRVNLIVDVRLTPSL